MTPIPFVDLTAQRLRLGDGIERAIARVLAHGAFILGPEVAELEAKLAAMAQVSHCITCGNGTDALQLVLMAEGIGPGDAIFVPSFTFVATGEIVPPTGATLVFVDVQEDSFNIAPDSLEAAIKAAQAKGLRPRAVIPVDLFGQPADYDRIGAIAAAHGMIVIGDAAQSFGAHYKGRAVGSLATYTTVSFFPSKPLGCYGDGGAVFTDDAEKAALLKSLRFHGKGTDKYDNVRLGLNSRLDTIQAAVLLQKLTIFEEEIEARQRIAARYHSTLTNLVETPAVTSDCRSVWAQYTIQLDARDQLAEACKQAGVPTAVYYPLPMHKQRGYQGHMLAPGGAPVAEKLAGRVLSLPMHPYLDEQTQDRVVEAIRNAL